MNQFFFSVFVLIFLSKILNILAYCRLLIPISLSHSQTRNLLIQLIAKNKKYSNSNFQFPSLSTHTFDGRQDLLLLRRVQRLPLDILHQLWMEIPHRSHCYSRDRLLVHEGVPPILQFIQRELARELCSPMDHLQVVRLLHSDDQRQVVHRFPSAQVLRGDQIDASMFSLLLRIHRRGVFQPPIREQRRRGHGKYTLQRRH